jgi:hypothetical protein
MPRINYKEILPENAKKRPTWKTLVYNLKYHTFEMKPASSEFFHSGCSQLQQSSDIEIMLRIIEYEYLLKEKKNDSDELTHFLIHCFNIELPVWEYEDDQHHQNPIYQLPYSYYKSDFFGKYPQFLDNRALTKLKLKIKTLEQYQAQILDKLTVFSEMIDDLQKKGEII